MRMRAAVLRTFGRPFEVAQVDLAAPRRDEVCVAIKATGVCHSDYSTAIGRLPHSLPCVLGHEAAGVVDEVGEGVTNMRPGDHGIVMFNPQYGECFFCRRGQRQLCRSAPVFGLMNDSTSRLSEKGELLYHGMNTATFAEYAILRSTAVAKIPNDVPFEVAAELGSAVLTGAGAAIHTAPVRPGDTVAVLGCGAVGLNVIQGARLAGAMQIVAIDPLAWKLERARNLGATHMLPYDAAKLPEQICALTEGRGADVVFEAVGATALQELAIELSRRGGKTILVGLAGSEERMSFPPFLFSIDEKEIKGCYYGSCDPIRDTPGMLGLWRAGRLQLESLVTATLPLEEINTGFDLMRSGRHVRVILTP